MDDKYEKMAQYLGVKMYMPFHVRVLGSGIYGSPYILKNNGLYDKNGNHALLAQMGVMFSGDAEISQEENSKDGFYYIDKAGTVRHCKYHYFPENIEHSMKLFGNMFDDESLAIKYKHKIKSILRNHGK